MCPTFMHRTAQTSRIFVLLISFFSLVWIGCGEDAGNRTANNTDNIRKYGGTFRMNILRGDPSGLDPVLVDSKHADDIASQIFDKLIDLNDSLKLVPELARSWKISEDGLSYTFNLRTDVNFQDHPCFPNGKGRRMTAHDVKYSFTRGCDPRQLTKAYWAFNGKVKGASAYYDAAAAGRPIEEVTGFVVENDSTFRIDLAEPYAPFIFILVNSLGSVVPHEAVEMYGRDFARNPVGTGPFRFDHWTELQEIVAVRNPNYWDRDTEKKPLPYLDSLRFTFVKEDHTQFADFIAGNYDEVFNIPTKQFPNVINAETLEPMPEYKKYTVQAAPAMLTWYFAFNNRRAPFNDANVRRAFNYAVDRARIVRFVLESSPHAPAIHGLTPPVFPDYPVESIEGYDYNADQARSLMAAAGYADGRGFPEITLYIYNEPRLREVAEAVQEQLSTTLNIKVALREMAFPQLIDLAESGKIEFWGTRWYGDYPDPETYLNLLNGQIVPKDPHAPSNPNSSRYDNPAYNEVFNQAMRTIDYIARMKKYQEAEQIAMDDAPIMPLFYERHYRLLQPWVRGLKLDAMARYDLKRVWFNKPELGTEPNA